MKEKWSVAVQIGLAEHCELEHLATSNREWKRFVDEVHAGENHIESIHHNDSTHFVLPKNVIRALANDRWVVYGVDADLKSIELVAAQTVDMENVHIWDRFVSSPDNEVVYLILNGEVSSNKVTLYELLKDIETEAAASIDLLFVDIDTGEYDVFMNYDFLIKPKVIHIEAHTFGIAAQLITKFLENDYILLSLFDTHNHEGSDLTLRFLRKDVAQDVAWYYLKEDDNRKRNDHFFTIGPDYHE